MKLLKTSCVMALAAGGAILLSAATAFGREVGPYARSLNQVGAIWLDSNSCQLEINNELADRGFALSSSPKSADAVLEVDVRPTPFSGGEKASYAVTMLGSNERVLFSTWGRENSHDFGEVCEDISEEIADRIVYQLS